MLISNPLKKKVIKKYTKKFMSKTSLSKSGKSAHFRQVFAKNFLVTCFKNFLNGFFLNFECKCARDGSKKRKTFFYKRVMEPSMG
jgi:hypothetical protein